MARSAHFLAPLLHAVCRAFYCRMRRFGFNLFAAILLTAWTGFAADTNEFKFDGVLPQDLKRGAVPANQKLPAFDEIYKLLRTNLGGVSEGDLDRAAVKGLLHQLQSQ